MRSQAEPLLYGSFGTDRGLALHEFVYAILDNPRLCAHVRQVRVYLSWTASEYENPIEAEMCEFFETKAREYGLTRVKQEINNEGLETLNDTAIKLLCLICPNLWKISFDVGTKTALERIFERDVDVRIFGPSLRELSFENDSVDLYGLNDGTDMIRYAGLFDCPNLEKIHFGAFDSINQNENQNLQELGVYKSVKSFHFVEGVLSGRDITQIAKCFPNLEDFEYSYEAINEERAMGFKGTELKQALDQWTKTLRRLSLDLCYDFGDGRGNRKADFIENFAKFEALEELEVESLFLLRERAEKHGDDMYYCVVENANLWENYFPPTLKRLRINRAYRNVEEPLRTLAEHVNQWLPNLEVIHISLGYYTVAPGYTDFSVPSGTQLKELYETVLTDSEVLRRLNSEFLAEDIVEVTRNGFAGITAQIPKQYVTEDDSRRPIDVAAAYIEQRFMLKHLPDLWQDLVEIFNKAGVRVVIDNTPLESVSFDTQGHDFKVIWAAMRRSPMPKKY